MANHRRRFASLIALVATAVLLLPACGESDSGESSGGSGGGADAATQEAVSLMDDGDVVSETGEAEVTVDAVDNNFKPKYIEVSKGTTVKFVNEGRNLHNVLPVADGAFTAIETNDFDPGEEGTITFDEAGDFPYYCSLHGTKTKGMIGGVRVVE